MTTDSDPTLSDPALAGLFGEALKVGVHAPPPEPPDWLSDEAFPHALVRYVGRGGSGFVWQAERRDGGGSVALKLVSFKGDRRVRLRWENECDTLSRVDHPNLVSLIDFGLAPDLDAGWVALEWIEGANLGTILANRGSLPVAEVVEFLQQVVSSLSALHDAGLLHRDIKPGNLLFEEASNRWVVADFGLAYELHAGRRGQSDEDLGKPGDTRLRRT